MRIAGTDQAHNRGAAAVEPQHPWHTPLFDPATIRRSDYAPTASTLKIANTKKMTDTHTVALNSVRSMPRRA